MNALQKFLSVDINLFSILMLFIIIAAIHIKENGISVSAMIFLVLCWSTIGLLVLETLPWLYDGSPGRGGFFKVYILNFALLLLTPFPPIVWLCYLDYLFHESRERLLRRWFYIQPLAVLAVIMILSIRSGFIFRVDEFNFYVRGPGFFIITIVNYSVIIFALIMALKNRKKTEHRVLGIVVIFSVAPAAGAILQLNFYGISAIWPLTALSVVLTYVFIEIQKEIRDYLTGLLTRQQIDEVIHKRIRDFGRKGRFALVMIDMDGFKQINDNYGHEAGDQALVSMAYALVRTVKRIDKVARFGGDEFLILLEADSEEVVSMVLLRLSERLALENSSLSRPFNISYSAGYAIYDPANYHGFKELFKDADRMMYEAKAVKR